MDYFVSSSKAETKFSNGMLVDVVRVDVRGDAALIDDKQCSLGGFMKPHHDSTKGCFAHFGFCSWPGEASNSAFARRLSRRRLVGLICLEARATQTRSKRTTIRGKEQHMERFWHPNL